MRVPVLKIKEAVNFTLLFLIGVNFLGIGFKLIILLLLLVVIENGISLRIEKDLIGIVLFLFLFTYAYFNHKYGENISVFYRYWILPYFFYCTGKNIYLKRSDLDFSGTIFCIALGLAIWGILNIYKTTISSITLQNRQSVDFWSNTAVASSKQAGYFFVLASIMGIRMWINKFKIFDIIMLLFVAIGLFTTGTRSLLFVFAAVILFGFIYFTHSRDYKSSQKKNKMQTIIGVVLVLLLAYSLDLFGIATKISSSTFVLRITGQAEHDNVVSLFNNNGRNLRYALFFSQVLSHPFGNISLGSYGSAHNTFFDIYRVGGVIPFTLFLVFMILVYKKLYRLLKNRKYRKADGLYIISIIGGMTLAFMSESMMALNIQVMSAMFFVVGILVQIEKKETTRANKEN